MTSVSAGGCSLCTDHCLPAYTYNMYKVENSFFQANLFRNNITNTSFRTWDLYKTRQMLYFGIPFTYPLKSNFYSCNWRKMSAGGITDICATHFHLFDRITSDQVCTLADILSKDSHPRKRKFHILLATNSDFLSIQLDTLWLWFFLLVLFKKCYPR